MGSHRYTTHTTQTLASWGVKSNDIVFPIPYHPHAKGPDAHNKVADSGLDSKTLGATRVFVRNHKNKQTHTVMVDLDKHTVGGDTKAVPARSMPATHTHAETHMTPPPLPHTHTHSHTRTHTVCFARCTTCAA